MLRPSLSFLPILSVRCFCSLPPGSHLRASEGLPSRRVSSSARTLPPSSASARHFVNVDSTCTSQCDKTRATAVVSGWLPLSVSLRRFCLSVRVRVADSPLAAPPRLAGRAEGENALTRALFAVV